MKTIPINNKTEEAVKMYYKTLGYFKMINEIETLNFGGCLVGAYAVWKRLELDGEDMSNVVLVQLANDWDLPSIQSNQEYLFDNSNTPSSSTHFALSLDWGKTLIDSEGDHTEIYDDTLIIEPEYVEELSRGALLYGSWNYDFDRRTEIPRINEILGLDVEECLGVELY